MPFLLAEILNFQDSAHLKGVGSLSYKYLIYKNNLFILMIESLLQIELS